MLCVHKIQLIQFVGLLVGVEICASVKTAWQTDGSFKENENSLSVVRGPWSVVPVLELI